MELITDINTTIVLLFCAMTAYQYLYILVSIFFPPRRYTAKKLHRYAVLICARDEETVIGNLIESIKRQKYPSELIDIYVMADNCSDDGTKNAALAAGATVYERHSKTEIGKGYALDCLIKNIRRDRGEEYYDGYFVFDADNLIASDYIAHMNEVFDNGYRVVTSYRNSKNFGANWITAGYGLMFMREARHMNNARMILHTSCVISGTGYLVHRDIINEKGGWPYHLLTEDLEFSMERIIEGEKIGYCHDAVFYDEQPTSFITSWRQRIRWSKGFMQALLKHGWRMVCGMFKRKSAFSCFDEAMSTLPTVILSIFGTLSIASMIITAIVCQNPLEMLVQLGVYLLGIYAAQYVLGLLTVITEWKKISCPWWKKILCSFTFPFFMMCAIPITVVALFAPAAWKPIKHEDTTTISELE